MTNTRLIMASSAVLLGLIGVSLLFFTEEIIAYFGLTLSLTLRLTLQIVGSLYFSLGMLNWMSQWGLIGGIYNKPVAVANFAHFCITALTLLREAPRFKHHIELLWILTGLYVVFSVVFGWLFFKGPAHKSEF